jgi:hypothetical protein
LNLPVDLAGAVHDEPERMPRIEFRRFDDGVVLFAACGAFDDPEDGNAVFLLLRVASGPLASGFGRVTVRPGGRREAARWSIGGRADIRERATYMWGPRRV